jgi:curli biogenesis system outer membrane secretion channel CsgG
MNSGGVRAMILPGCLVALLTAWAGSATAAPKKGADADAERLRKRIAVVDFIDKTDYGKGRLGIAASDILEGELQRSGKFTIVSHSGMDEVLNLQALGQSGALDASTAVQAGRLVGANAIINGSVSEFGIKKSGFSVPGVVGTKTLLARAVVDIHVIDGATGVILLSETAEGETTTRAAKVLNIGGEGTYDETLAGKALREAIATLVDKITSKLDETPWEGFVLSSEGSSAWVTGGQDVGLKKGMELVISSAPQQITAPNGKTYSLPGETRGVLQINEVMPDISRATVTQGRAEKDDLVRLGGRKK